MLLVHICAILEVSKRSYVKGGTQSSATTRRTESGHEKICRPRPHGHRAAKEEAPPIIGKAEVVQCSYGAIVRQHMMPKHVKKDKHKRILAAISAAPLPPSAPSLFPSLFSLAHPSHHVPSPFLQRSVTFIFSIHIACAWGTTSFYIFDLHPYIEQTMLIPRWCRSHCWYLFSPYLWVYQSSMPWVYIATNCFQSVCPGAANVGMGLFSLHSIISGEPGLSCWTLSLVPTTNPVHDILFTFNGILFF